jgi:protein-S-isoprenylcysteine O-methyltransferase Ste14
MGIALINLFGLIITWGIWLWLATRQFSLPLNLIIALAGAVFIAPLVLLGRWFLDRQPTVRRAEGVTGIIHYLVAIFLGSALICGTRVGLEANAWPIPLSPGWGLVLMFLSGLLWVAVIFNLILKGLGAPFAVSLTRVVVTDWAYAWTRNPMVLASLAFLVGLGLWLRSALFLIWLLAVVSPAILMFLKLYEERELEIRFGAEYQRYKARTPMFLPRKPST